MDSISPTRFVSMIMKPTVRTRRALLALSMITALWSHVPVQGQGTTPDALIKEVSSEVLDAIKSDKEIQAGDTEKVLSLVEAKVMPHVDSQRMTSSAVGRFWREASPQQKVRLQEEFKLLVLRTYAGALTQVRNETVQIKPLRGGDRDGDVVVKTAVRGRGDPIQLDYRLEKVGTDWRIYDVNVLGVWLTENYRNSFAQEIGTGGIDGLIAKLTEKNKSAGKK